MAAGFQGHCAEIIGNKVLDFHRLSAPLKFIGARGQLDQHHAAAMLNEVCLLSRFLQCRLHWIASWFSFRWSWVRTRQRISVESP